MEKKSHSAANSFKMKATHGTSIMTPKRGRTTSLPVCSATSFKASFKIRFTIKTSSSLETIGNMISRLPNS